MTTTRQEIALRLYFSEGWSYRRIGSALGHASPASTYSLVQRGVRAIVRACDGQGANTSPIVRALFAPSARSSTTRDAHRAFARQEELLERLDRRMAKRACELADIVECMCGESLFAPHPLRNRWDQWELRYLAQRPWSAGIPGSAYEARGVHFREKA